MTQTWQTSWPLIEKADCRHCGRPSGKQCQDPRGRPAPPHQARRDDAAAQGFYVPGRGSLVKEARDA